MLTHRVKLPDGTEIEFFASDEATFEKQFSSIDNLNAFQKMQNVNQFYQYLNLDGYHERGTLKRKAKSVKLARKRQKQARRKQR